MKIYISAGDGPGYNEDGLAWCDVYAKRTLLVEEVPEEYASKIIPMGPHFGIRVWGLRRTLWHIVKSYVQVPDCGGHSVKDQIGYSLKQYYYRHPESAFVPGQSRSDYIFYASTLYPTHPGYNRLRALFINACRATPGVQFEGGLVRKDDFQVDEYRHITIGEYYDPSTWLAKVKKSAVGFWAPGDQGAMTLKMGEFLACGKAIIAVPIRQEQLPAPLVHGEHVHFVDDNLEAMKEAVRLLTSDHDYRRKLERNARRYYEKYVAPEQALRRFIREACARTSVDLL